jgi:hypothetical protein
LCPNRRFFSSYFLGENILKIDPAETNLCCPQLARCFKMILFGKKVFVILKCLVDLLIKYLRRRGRKFSNM